MTDSIIEKITNTDPESKSLDLEAHNIEQLKQLFPDVFREGKVDFEVLKAVLGEHVEDKEERYNFTWHGKNKARQIAQTPSTGTLRPCKEESVNWDTTQNLFIEGDNLEVLKLLQKSYHQKLKMIFIDPPYNTGNDFVYKDNFRDNITNYLELTNQVDSGGRKLSKNTDTSGRYHTDWLDMMYPRLKLARNLLKDDGVIFISIDDNEITNLRKLCDEIFGEDNFVTSIAWQKKVSPSNDAKWFSSDHDHIIVYAKNKSIWRPFRLPMNEKQKGYYKNPDKDPRGDWNSATYTCNKNNIQRPNLYYPLINPNTGEEVWPKKSAVWKYTQEKSKQHAFDNLIYWGKDGNSNSPRMKTFLTESTGVVPRTVWLYTDVGHTQEATKVLGSLITEIKFETPKPPRLIKHMLHISTSDKEEDIILDFFSGSSSTAHAVMEINSEQSGNRKHIMVQIPEPIDNKKYHTIAEIGKDRIRKAGVQIANQTEKEIDVGFKVFKLDKTNINQWEGSFDNLSDILDNSVDSIKPGRTSEDVIYEILIKYGLDLTYPITEHILAGKTVYNVAFGSLIVCLDDGITRETVEAIGKLKQELDSETTRVVFKDAGFADDAVKVNAIQLLKQYGVDDVKSI